MNEPERSDAELVACVWSGVARELLACEAKCSRVASACGPKTGLGVRRLEQRVCETPGAPPIHAHVQACSGPFSEKLNDINGVPDVHMFTRKKVGGGVPTHARASRKGKGRIFMRGSFYQYEQLNILQLEGVSALCSDGKPCSTPLNIREHCQEKRPEFVTKGCASE